MGMQYMVAIASLQQRRGWRARRGSQNRKTPHCREQSMRRKVCVTVAPDTSCVNTVMDCPAERVLRGWISEGTSQPRGPQA